MNRANVSFCLAFTGWKDGESSFNYFYQQFFLKNRNFSAGRRLSSITYILSQSFSHTLLCGQLCGSIPLVFFWFFFSYFSLSADIIYGKSKSVYEWWMNMKESSTSQPLLLHSWKGNERNIWDWNRCEMTYPNMGCTEIFEPYASMWIGMKFGHDTKLNLLYEVIFSGWNVA